jgi:multidrug efflux system membrane fusion protein
MASGFFKPSRLIAIGLIVVTAAWIGSGILSPHAQEGPKSSLEKAKAEAPKQRVTVMDLVSQPHNRLITLSGVTQADRRAFATSRGAGLMKEIRVQRGAKVKAGDVIAVISDEGRQAAVNQAKALLDQRNTELNAQKPLIERGIIARNQLNSLEANVAAAKSALATAQAELERMDILAPIDGLVDSIPVEIGQAVQAGAQVAEVIGPDPMLAVGGVAEKERSLIKTGQKVAVRFIDGRTASGEITFVSLAGEKGTRTYRVEARLPNPDAAIADGVTCEMTLTLPAVEASPVPRSALVFSDTGELGVRIVDDQNIARFKKVTLVDDQNGTLWVQGVEGKTRLITVGQDFVKEGDAVEAAPAANS